MKKTLPMLYALCFMLSAGTANASELTVYYSPTCPHCHHARDFIKDTLAPEYPDMVVTEINASDPSNTPVFREVVKKCELKSGGVPIVVIGDKCFQGYGQATGDRYREALNAELKQDEVPADEIVAEPALDENAAEPINDAAQPQAQAAAQQPVERSFTLVYALIGILLVAIGFVAFMQRKKK